MRIRARFTRALLLLVLACCPPAWAERYLGISPDDRLTDVRALFPNASLKEEKPAWLQQHQRLVEISGPGIDGVVALRVEHEEGRIEAFQKQMRRKQESGGVLSPVEAMVLESYARRLVKLQSERGPDPWIVQDIRWAPPQPISVAAAITRYGPPDRDNLNEQFKRVLEWPDRGISGFVGEHGRLELLVFEFTARDHLCASQWKRQEECDVPVPEQQRKPPPSAPAAASAPKRK